MRIRLSYFINFLTSVIIGFFSIGCQKAIVPGNYSGIATLPEYRIEQMNHNNSFYPEFSFHFPMQLKKQFKTSSTPQQQIRISDDVIFVPTKDGKMETYSLTKLDQIGNLKFDSNIRGNVVPVKQDILIAMEYGRKSLILYNLEKKKKIWTAELGSVATIPKIINNKIIVASLYNGVFCLDFDNGNTLWQRELNSQLHTSPVITDECIFQATDKGTIVALSVEDGDTIWQQDLQSPVFSSPVLIKENLICCTRGGSVVNLEPLRGEKRWLVSIGGMARRTPAASSQRIVVADQNGNVSALAIDSGKLIWQYSVGTIIGTDPVITRDHVIFGTLDNHLMVLDLDSGDPLWEVEVFGRVRTNPVVRQNELIFGSEDNNLYVFAQNKPQ